MPAPRCRSAPLALVCQSNAATVSRRCVTAMPPQCRRGPPTPCCCYHTAAALTRLCGVAVWPPCRRLVVAVLSLCCRRAVELSPPCRCLAVIPPRNYRRRIVPPPCWWSVITLPRRRVAPPCHAAMPSRGLRAVTAVSASCRAAFA